MPKDFRKKDFGRALRGYAVDEVDKYLEAVTGEYRRLEKRSWETSKQLADAEKRLDEYAAAEADAAETLDAADSILEDANRQAGAILADSRVAAQQEAQGILKQASAAATKTKDDALILRRKAESLLREADSAREAADAARAKAWEEIAAEKAGIMVPGVPVIFDGNDDRVKRVLEEHAVRLGCPAVCVTKEEARITEYTESSIVFRTGDEAAEREYRIPFIAEYQVMNALLAISAIRTLAPRLSVPEEALKEGLREACWEGRMEQVLPGVYLDGAHNEDGVRQFIKTAARLGKEHRIGLVFSAVSDKDYPRMVQEMTEQLPLSFAVTTQVGGGRQVPAGELAELFRRNGCERVIECPFPAEAFAEALRQKQEKEILFCVGSLYLVGEIKALINRRSTGMEIQI